MSYPLMRPARSVGIDGQANAPCSRHSIFRLTQVVTEAAA
jgi:hypothetical protein